MERIYDLVIIGAGPSGLSAGIYAGRAMLDVLVLEKAGGGQIALTTEVVNYPGILEISGSELSEQMRKQAENFGVNFAYEEVESMDLSKDIKVIKTHSGEYKALSVIISTGASPRKLNFKGEAEYTGRGVAYCATCDGEFFTGLEVFVVGAGFAAAEEAIFLTKYASKVKIIAREPEFTCAKSISEKVLNHPKIEVNFNTELLEIGGDIQLRWAKLKNNISGEITEYKAAEGETFGVFIFVGYEPQSALFKEHVNLDNFGYIPTDEDLMTNVNGVYAAGDIRPKKLKQVVTAVSDGAIAATSVEKFVLEAREKLGLQKEEKVKEKTSKVEASESKFLDEALVGQLADIIARFENKINIALLKDSSNEKTSEMLKMLSEIADISDKVSFASYEKGENKELEAKIGAERFPTIALLDSENNFSGIKYSTLPSGHELNSFILAMYNVAGPGQKLSDSTLETIAKLDKPINIKIGVSLTCTKCPETVQSSQRISTLNKNIEVEVIDVFTFGDFKKEYDIMSVPALVVNDSKLYFGQKNIDDMIKIIEENN